MENNGVSIGTTFDSPFGTTHTLSDLVSLVLRLSFVGAGLIVLTMFLIAGWKVLHGAGNSDPQEAAKGKAAATSAALGFIIIFVSYWVIRFIELMTGNDFITNPNL